MIRILLVGYGHMGKALATDWIIDSELEVSIVSPELDRVGTCYTTVDQLPATYSPDVIVFAIKPQIMPDVLSVYKRLCTIDTLVISIAAGFNIKRVADVLTGRVVRVMPNLPVTTGLGIYGIFSHDATHQDRVLIEKMLSNSGTILWLNNEDQIDRITAISGSGPAYFYFFTEALQHAAKKLGFDDEQSILLAQATFVGAAELLKVNMTTAEDLRIQVTSPGGTTAAALQSFTDNKINNIVLEAVDSAYNRAKELSQ
ncbi:MAG: pyrroline-5-carboxylate reductase [Candidatus Paracaedibacteraceae bacterium]|nr:pyrroline-5-carboxylate reductase [Candidatus Paracaedibacteraceae bacterium]